MVGGFFVRWPDSFPSDAPLCLYAEAVASACENPALRPGLMACHVAAERRGIAYQQHQRLQWCSLPAMLEQYAAAQPEAGNQTELIVEIARIPTALQLAESLDLLLAALALDWSARLIVSPLAVVAFRLDRQDDVAKPFASLSLYGLAAIETETTALALAPPLVLPLQARQDDLCSALLRFDLTLGQVWSHGAAHLNESPTDFDRSWN